VKPHLDDVLVPESTSTDSPTHEFVSDTFRASSSDLEEVREGMKKLGMDPAKRNGKFQVKPSIIHSDHNVFNYSSAISLSAYLRDSCILKPVV
jgi:hypothetical protein